MGEFSPEFVVIVVAVDEKDIAREGFEPVDVLSVCAGILDAVVFSTGIFGVSSEMQSVGRNGNPKSPQMTIASLSVSARPKSVSD